MDPPAAIINPRSREAGPLIKPGVARARRGPPVLLAGCLALVVFVAAGPAWAQISREEAASRIESDYDVQVLRVRAGDIDGRAVWLVTVMNPGGDFNEAFQVTTLAVDSTDGSLVPAFRHGPTGARGGGDAVDMQIDRRPSAMQSGPWR